MLSWRRKLGLGALLIAGAAAVFVVPTIWGRPWSVSHVYDRVFIEAALKRPMLLSRLRVLEPYGIEFHSDELDDFSVAFELASAVQVRESLELLRSYDRASQSPGQRLSTEILDWYLASQVDGEPFLFHDFPVNQMNGIQSGLPDFMLNVHQLRNPADAENYVARLALFGVALDQIIDGLKYRESHGVLPPRFVARRVLVEVGEFRAPPAEEHVLFTHFSARIDEIDELSADRRGELRERVRGQIQQTIYPAYERLAAYLRHVERVAGDDDGVWRLPDGDAYYAWVLRAHTTTDSSADEIHALGLAEVARIHARMREILVSVGRDGTNLIREIELLKQEPRFHYPDDDRARAQILGDYQQIVDDATARLPEFFGVLPSAPVVVKRVPEFRQAGAAGAYYTPPPFDGSRPGVFYANLRDVGEIVKFRMRTLAYHEAIPGHHLQIAIAQELEDVPFFRRILPFTGYVEGWALYAERLAVERGLHSTPYDELGQLIDEVFRAVRLVVDTGIHAKHWSRERAIDYMFANTGMERAEVVVEIERYIVMPGQACSYKMGQLAILDLRARARQALGDRFDLRAFHDQVLGRGALPAGILERIVEEWIAEQSS